MDRTEEPVMERGRRLIYRRMILLEGSIRHREFSSLKELLGMVDELISLYEQVDDCPTVPVSQMICQMLEEFTRHWRLIEADQISWRAIRAMRFEAGRSDLEVIEAVRKCRKEGKQHENPGGKIKCLDPRFARLS